MSRSLPVFFLFLVILLEGYVVLSSELMAIRQSIPFVGSGTDTVSIIIAAVLMPLAFGYQAGGHYKPGYDQQGTYRSVRKKLIHNLFVSLCILSVGLSYPLVSFFFHGLTTLGLDNRILMVTLYSCIFLVIPVYLMGQTIPLISNYFSKEKLSKVTGKILFVSTFGSFLGAVFSTLVLVAYLGVNISVSLNFLILGFLIILLSKRKFTEFSILVICIVFCGLYLNSSKMMDNFNVVKSNQYNFIQVVVKDKERHLLLNNNNSSMFTEDGRKHDYIEFIEDVAIKSIHENEEAKDILVIGAGAFTLGFEDTKNNYDYVDIDKDLKGIAEEYILKSKLTDNKTFHPLPVRAFLMKTQKQYDVIILDAYLGALTLPEHLVTKEFFQQVKSHLKDDGVLVGNFIKSPNFQDKFSRNIDNTLREAYPHISRHVMHSKYSVWNNDPDLVGNVIYIYKNSPSLKSKTIYTDNKNSVFYDKPHRLKTIPHEEKTKEEKHNKE